MRRLRLCTLALLTVVTATSVSPARAADADVAGIELYEKKVRPVLAKHCYECHGPEKQEANLRVDSVAAMLRGGDQGSSLVPGDPDMSLLVIGIRYEDLDFQMPPKGKMSEAEVAGIVAWIQGGAAAPKEDERPAAMAKPAFDLNERKKHWCFQPLAPAGVPQVADSAWPAGDVDRFVLAKLEAGNLKPAADADPAALCRRLYFDLVGLPPTPAEVDEFVRSYSPSDARERESGSEGERAKAAAALVDKLLASPHFGERWARHWLDLVRYAETRGHEFDYVIPNAYQYRDYVIRAFNADVPYDRFVVEHLAGDLIAAPRTNPATGANESILGTGFYFLGEEVHSPVDIRQDETDRVDNKIDVLSKTFLGLTLSCARCHDHKFDALSTKDYYALAGYVLSLSYRQAAFETTDHNRRIYDEIKTLERMHDRSLREAQYELLQPMLGRAGDYLSACVAVRAQLQSAGKSADREAIVRAAASEHGVDATRLTAWGDYAESPAAKIGVFPLWLAAASGNLPDFADAMPEESATFQPRVLVDYARPGAGEWVSDGAVFGDHPRSIGALRFGASPDRPIERIEPMAAAAADLNWDVFRGADDNEPEPGRLNWQQFGRTLKTPTFTIGTGKIRVLIRGSAKIYAAVDSHRVNNGPLHGKLIRIVPGDDSYRWIEHDLSAYQGQRCHLEFSPIDAAEVKDGQSRELAVRGVIEMPDNPNPMPLWRFGDLDRSREFTVAWLERLRTAADEKDPQRRADRVAAEIAQFVDAVARRAFLDEQLLDTGEALVADWLVSRPDLWSTPSTRAAELVKPFFDRRGELQRQLKLATHTAPAAWEGTAVDEHVLIRGNHRTPGDLVPRRFLEALDGPTPAVAVQGRLELAQRLVDGRDPLPARVMVNRIWQHLFGRGLVATVDNFGAMGEMPTHPELLDHLAWRFMAEGWSIKRLIRELALSRTYRMASTAADPGADEADPKNDLLHRANVKRLEAEIIRDAILAVGGRFDPKLFGPSVEVHLTPFMEGRGRPASGPLDGAGRRSIYLRVRRNFLNPMFQAYDYPTPFTTVGRRSTSNVPAQALALMNGQLVSETAAAWSARLIREVPADADARLDRLYQEALSRPPTEAERTAARRFLVEQAKLYDGASIDDPRVWADLCHTLYNVKEFIFIR